MANNRMYLVHKPTGERIKLGKRMAGGYYRAPPQEELQAFFDICAVDFGRKATFDSFDLEFEMDPDWEL